jgi:sugar transferase (PEP-CTERM/EpsH1 system associated)
VRILWLKTELLHPIDKGGKIRTYAMLKELKREHHITYLTLDDGSAAPNARELAQQYCHELVTIPHSTSKKFSAGFYRELAANLASPLPYFMKKYESAAMRSEITERTSDRSFDILVCDFLMPAINVPDDLPCATLLFQHNVEAMIWQRHYEVQTNPIKKLYLHNQWTKTRKFEKAACRRFDQVVAVSAKDAEIMSNQYGVEGVVDVPTGVDTDYFRPSGAISEPNRLVFTGSMDWLPNSDAIHYFTEEILPRIKESVPDVKLTVVGRNPFPSLVELSKTDPAVEVTGRVDDVRPYIEKASAYVVPLRIGGGTRLKIFEAMAMEKPVISTSVGAEGLPVSHGEELLLADTPDTFAARVVEVLTNDALAHDLGRRSAQVVRERFGWPSVAERFAEFCDGAHRRIGPVSSQSKLREGLRTAI